MIKKTRFLLLLVGVIAATVTASLLPASAAAGDSARKVIARDFPDPAFGKFTTKALGTRYYLYATGRGFDVASSTHPRKGYRVHGRSMVKHPAWVVNPQSGKAAHFWAPHVFQSRTTPGNERFTMYFTAHRKTDNRHCIGAAVARSPKGPFVPQAKPLVCPPKGYSEALDPGEYVTQYNNRYLIYKLGNYSPRRFQIMAMRVGNDLGVARAGKPRVILSKAKIGKSVAEAPDIYRSGNGRVHLFLSRNGYKDCDYATQVWSGKGLWSLKNPKWVTGMGPNSKFCGPGGAEVIKDGKNRLIAFHVRVKKNPLRRHAYVGVFRWSKKNNPYLA